MNASPVCFSRRQALLGALGLGAGAALVTLTGCTPPPATTVKASDVPVGGGAIVGDFVVTQPTAGVFQAYDAACPHARKRLSRVRDGRVECDAHGARFDIATGDATAWPNQRERKPLAPAVVTRDGDTLTLRKA